MPLFFIMTIEEYANKWKKFSDGLEDVLINQMHQHKELAEEFITEQLYSGVDGDENPLRPKYTEDPYFKTDEAGHWKNNAKGYMKWKASIQAPARSYLGFSPRSKDTPNLIIRGDFYFSITAIPIKDGLMISSQGVSFSSDIERKYSPSIYKIGNKAKKHYVTYYMLPQIKTFFKSCGL